MFSWRTGVTSGRLEDRVDRETSRTRLGIPARSFFQLPRVLNAPVPRHELLPRVGGGSPGSRVQGRLTHDARCQCHGVSKGHVEFPWASPCGRLRASLPSTLKRAASPAPGITSSGSLQVRHCYSCGVLSSGLDPSGRHLHPAAKLHGTATTSQRRSRC